MSLHTPSTFARLFARARLVATAAALVAVSVQVAAAAPLTQSFNFDEADSTVAAFNTNLGTLLGIDITLDTGLSAINPLSNQGQNPGTCIASFVGGSYAISAPASSTVLLTLTGDGNVNFNCGQFEVALLKHGSTSVDSSLFGAFSRVGVSPIALGETIIGGSALIVQGAGSSGASTIWDPRLTSGTLTYTYCPVGQNCSTDTPPPPTIPEPATAAMLAVGLAGVLVRRRKQE